MWPFKKNNDYITTPLIHIHEDDCGMRSLYPLSAWDQVADDIDSAIEHAEKHADPNTGFSNEVRMIQAPKVDYSSTGLRVEQLKANLKDHMPVVPRFYATTGIVMETGKRDPYGIYEENAACFGFDEQCYLKVEHDGVTVKCIWFEADTTDPTRLSALKASLLEVEKLVPSVIADYWLYTYGPISDDQFLTEYFGAIADCGT